MPIPRLLSIAFTLALAPLAAWAQGCELRHQLAFPDGAPSCLTAYKPANSPAPGFGRSIADVVPPSGIYSVAASRLIDGHCAEAVGFAIDVSGNSATAQDPANVARRNAAAVRSCQAVVDRHRVPLGCTCELVVVDGRSVLPKAEFEQRYLPGYAAPAPVPVVRERLAPEMEEAARAALAGGDPQREELLATLSKRLQELEAERAAAAAAAPVAAAAAAPSAMPAGVPRFSARALVIGNSRYTSFGPLTNPVRDARAIAQKLRGFGIEADLVLDASRDALIHALNEHARKAAGKDVSILFYAGHGVQVEGTNYLIPVDMRADGITAGYVKLAGISLNATLDYLPGKTRLVFLDACRDNPASRSLVATRSSVSAVGLAPVNAASGTLLSYATRDGATADDGNGLNSPYTTALLRHLDAPADISLVLRQVRQTVLQLTGGRQEPWEYGSLVGDQIVLSVMAR